jgi:hypothetical protein
MQEMHLCSSLDSGVTSGSVDEEELELLSVTLAASRLVEESKVVLILVVLPKFFFTRLI